MPRFMRRSLLVQLFSVYLLFVIIVLIGGAGVNIMVEQRLRSDVQAADQALAQEIALETSLQLSDAEHSLITLGKLVMQNNTPGAIENTFHAYQIARHDVDYVYWLDPLGILHVSWPRLG